MFLITKEKLTVDDMVDDVEYSFGETVVEYINTSNRIHLSHSVGSFITNTYMGLLRTSIWDSEYMSIMTFFRMTWK